MPQLWHTKKAAGDGRDAPAALRRSMFRKHQDQFGELCYGLRTGRGAPLHSIVCSITPGGGKSMLPVIAASQLIGPVADRICWVVPRRSLQQQAEQEFLKPRMRELLGNQHTIRRSTNEADPCRGLVGFVTTYQAIGMGNSHLRQEFSQRRYILVLDEPHHIEEGGAWETALAPLVKRAALTVYMSGTLERGNQKRIAFLPYASGLAGEVVNLHGSPGTAAISYSRREALLEQAILPIHFELMDGTAEWIGRDGVTYSSRLSEANKDTPEAIYTALKTQFAYQLLEETVGHWTMYRQTHPRAKLLVVTANIEDAKKYLDHLKKQGIKAAIATSDDSTLAATNIELYRTVGRPRSLDALVTVAMAYEGLDVPSITHIACLTHIRSKPWIEQMIARATRFDEPAGPWDGQMAFVYTPDDRYMCSIIQRMQNDQMTALKQKAEDPDGNERDYNLPDRTPSEERNSIVPVGSQGGPRRWSRVGHFATPGAANGPRPPEITSSQQEAELRDKINTHCKQVDLQYFDRKWGAANKQVAKAFKRPRATMTLAQLTRVVAWLEEKYPVEAASASAPRA